MRRGRLLTVTLLVALVVACDDGDADPAADTTSPPASTARPDTSAAVSDPPTTTTTTSRPTTAAPTTVPAPTTSPDDALKAQIAADYERTFFERYEMLRTPSLDDLDARVAAVLAPGSPVAATFTARIQQLVELGDVVVPNDPDELAVFVENVELIGPAPYEEAHVTVCEVDNRKQVTPAENSPNGIETDTFGSGELLAIRLVQVVRLTPSGWLLAETPTDSGQAYPERDTCPPE